MSVFPNSSEKNTTGAQDWTEVYEAVRWIQLAMALLSVLGSASIIVCVMLQRLSRTPELQPLFLLSVSDLLLALCWLIGAALFSQRRSSLNTHCYHLHTVEQILYMASFFYTLNYVWDLYKGVREQFYSCSNGYSVQFSNRMSTAGKTTALLSGLIPVLLMTPVFIQGNISQCQANFSEPYRPSMCTVLNQVSADAHRSTVSHLRATPASQSLQPAAHIQHRHLPRHLLPHTRQHHRPRGESLSYLQTGCDIERLPWQPAAGVLPCDGPADAPVPADLCPLLGSSGGSGVSAGGEALSGSGRGRGRPLHLTGFHLGLSGIPQLSGLRVDSSTSPASRQEGFVSRRGHSDATAEGAEGEKLPNTPQHQLKDQRTD
ncbi:transmembrane protein 116 isoform X1 [Dicentrarchus labrax]|uniref:transmembrane protein 116 isoform X1 n=1 Tax=Dicentrarchus labrax TaxID=13489 RepID=UPI0021F68DDA|nr:transmembrane protein 116 isoform X1 [Dicentrarchus labrax]